MTVQANTLRVLSVARPTVRFMSITDADVIVQALINIADIAYQEFDIWVVLLRSLDGFCLNVYANHVPPSMLVEIVGCTASPAASIQNDATRLFCDA